MSAFLDTIPNPDNGLDYAPEWAGTNIYLASQRVTDCVEALYPEERPVIASSAPLRQRTFSSGRRCARIALAEAGFPAMALPRAEDGSVCWPEGVVGSVSHTNDWAVAAVAPNNEKTIASMAVTASPKADLWRRGRRSRDEDVNLLGNFIVEPSHL